MSSKNKIKYPWCHDRRFNSYSGYFRNKFGYRIQKVSVDAGFTCPNRDGTKAYGGCTFCLNDAFNPSYCVPEKSITTQIREGIEFHKWRYAGAVQYLAYFQAFSNTYAPLGRLKQVYEEALSYPGVAGIVIGTRPDCIDDEKLEYIKSLSEKYYVAVEYGIESCYDKTLERINRGHTFAQAVAAVENTSALGINTGAHFIFGFPGETHEDMLREAEIISSLPLTTVKFHQLQIIKGTLMEREFLSSPQDFHPFTLEEYVPFIISFLEQLNPDIVVERFTGEAPPRFLSSEPWTRMRADQVGSLIEKRMEEMDTWQGRKWKNTNSP